MMVFVIILAAFLLAPGTASAEPISSAIFTILASAGASVGFAATVASFVTKLIVGVVLSLLGQISKDKPKVRQQGIQTEQTTTGDTTPQKFVVGRYAAEGHAVAPAYSHGPNNVYLTYILEVSNIPVVGLTGRVVIDGQWTDIDSDPENASANYGAPLTGLQNTGSNRGWIKFYDGTQTIADPMLVSKYSAHPDRPWTSSHILKGTAYAILTFRLDQEVFSGMPSVRFEVDGIEMYDPRKDTSVGGSGAHRWADTATWEFTRNPQVVNYNILRGITLPTGDIYGGQVPAEDIPLDNWFAGMNECDDLIGERVQYQAGFEIDVSVEPGEIIKEMNKASFAEISEFGGVFRIRVGAPSAAVLSIMDGDLLISKPSDLNPFPGLQQTHNAITGTSVEPNDVWQGRSLDPIFNPAWEAADGGRRLAQNVGLPAVSNKSQGQHLLSSYIANSRRFRTHRMVLPPSYATIEPLDTIGWTSARNGYTSKLFEVTEVEDTLDTMLQLVTVRERDAGDVAWTSSDDVPQPLPTNSLTRPPQTVPTLVVTDVAVNDNSAAARRPAIKLAWPFDEAPSAQTLKYEIRVLSDAGNVVTSGVVGARDGQTVTGDGILPDTTYEVRARYVTDMPTDWTAWLPVTTLDIRLGDADLADTITDQIADANAAADSVRADHDALVDGFAGKLTDEFDATRAYSDTGDMGIQSQIDLISLSINNASYIRKVDGEGGVGQWEPLAGAVAPTTGTNVIFGESGDYIQFTEGGMKEGPYYTGRNIKDTVFRFRGPLAVSSGASVRIAIVGSTTGNGPGGETILGQSDPITGWWQQVDIQFTVTEDTDEWAPAILLSGAGGYARIYRVRLEDYSAAASLEASIQQNYTLIQGETDVRAQADALIRAEFADGDAALDGEIASIKALDVDSGTAFGVLLDQLNVNGGGTSATVSQQGVAIADLEGNASASFVWRAVAGSATAELELVAADDPVSGPMAVGRFNGDLWIFENSVSARLMKIDEALILDAKRAGFIIGKQTAYDPADGLYMGRTEEVGGAVGFGLAMSKTAASGLKQHFEATAENGLRLTNANFFRDLDVTPGAIGYTTSQTVNLSAASRFVTLTLQGAGGGGASGRNRFSQQGDGSVGGNTVVQLRDGSTVISTWIASGGDAGNGAIFSRFGQPGEDSPWGTGGTAGASVTGGDATGYGAGGGGGALVGGAAGSAGERGYAGAHVTTPQIDVSGLSDPKLVITIGAKGIGGVPPTEVTGGGDGSPGRVAAIITQNKPVAADVIPLGPTANGLMIAGGPFPNLGAGLWVLSSNAPALDMGFVRVNAGRTLAIIDDKIVTFVSDRTPTFDINNNQTHEVRYNFHKMGP